MIKIKCVLSFKIFDLQFFFLFFFLFFFFIRISTILFFIIIIFFLWKDIACIYKIMKARETNIQNKAPDYTRLGNRLHKSNIII